MQRARRVPRRDRRARRRFEATVGFLEGDGVQLFFNDPIEIPDAALRAVRRMRVTRGDGGADAAVAEARTRARLRRRHRPGLRDLRRGRLRGPIRLRGDRSGDESRIAPRGRGGRRASAHLATSLRRGGVRRRSGAGRRVHAQGVRAPRRRLQRRRGSLAVQRPGRSRSCVRRGSGWCWPPRPIAAVSSASCTTAPSSAWPRSRSSCNRLGGSSTSIPLRRVH